ncbi:MAG: Uma2 family endonuclease [Pegethrix bostrychoides GSE-TBD4-15B]|uniref:Uma2 family endonuclease n=1 Tax=Pegethrix bostrychoides GSE-TBD4-15B TaxID=2839662 RepID=A0A951U4P7_9CYAN|nr:Uma2 family endonuclease [Pegethrix bostrychoides GSE-TBD4-15B]
MTQAQLKFHSFDAYLSYGDHIDIEAPHQLINGELVELPPESEPNSWIGRALFLILATSGIIPPRLVVILGCEVQVPTLQPKDPANRFPDLVVLRPEHLQLTQKRLTITLDMPPPRLIAEVLSPGKPNHDRDYIYKRSQYAAIGVPEYWLLDPVAQTVLVLTLDGQDYREVGRFSGNERVVSVEFAQLQLTARQIFESDF